MLQKIIGQFTRDERLYDDEKIKNLAKRFPSENSPDGQRMIMYMLLFSWYTRNTVLPFTADQIVSLVDSIIDVYYNQEYQQMNNIMISLIRNDLQRMSFWSNEYVFKTFFNDDFIKEDNDKMYVNLEKLSIFNKWILQNPQNVEFYNYSHLLVQKCNANNKTTNNKHLQYVHNYTIIVSDNVPQNVVQIHCPKCDILTQISKDDFLKMCRNYEKSSAKFSQGISIYCHKCDTQINFIRLYGNFKVLYGGGFDSYGPPKYSKSYQNQNYQNQYQNRQNQNYQNQNQNRQKPGYQEFTENFNCVDSKISQEKINDRQTKIEKGEQAEWDSLQTIFEQFGAIVQNKKADENKDWTYQQAQEWYKRYVANIPEGLIFGGQEEYFIFNPQGVQVNDFGLKEIFKYFAKQQAEHTDMVYYSGKLFTQKITEKIEGLNGEVEELNKLRECLESVQNMLKQPPQNELTLKSDGINKDKLKRSNYKLLKLFPKQHNEYYQTIYFVSNLGQPTNIYDTFKILREYIEYISLCHGGIIIKIPFEKESEILKAMIENIKFLLNDNTCNIQYVNDNMKRLIIFIAIMSKYEKDTYKNSEKFNQSTLRDDLYCFKSEDEYGKNHSFYKTFMQLYYAMLLWDETDTKPFDLWPDRSGSNRKIINTLRDTFTEFYKNLKQDDNDVNKKLVYSVQNNSTEQPLKNKYLSFLMTLYTYDDWIGNIFDNIYKIPIQSTEDKQRSAICFCLIEWVRNFVVYMLTNVYKYGEQNLKDVREAFLSKRPDIAQNSNLDEILLNNLKIRPQTQQNDRRQMQYQQYDNRRQYQQYDNRRQYQQYDNRRQYQYDNRRFTNSGRW